MATYTINHLGEATGQTRYAIPITESLANWTTQRVQLVEALSPNQGRYAASVTDANPHAVFDGVTQPTDWTQALDVAVPVVLAFDDAGAALANAADQTAIKAKTDNLPADPGDQSVLAASIAALPQDKTGYTLTPAYDAAKGPAGANKTATGFSTHSAADVWSVTARGLTTFGTLASDVATAVWSAAGRSITGLTTAALAMFANTDTGETTPVAGSVAQLGQGTVDASGLATDADMQTLLARTVTGVTFNSPLAEEGTLLETVRGDDYIVGSQRGALEWTPHAAPDWPDMAGATVKFTTRRKSDDAIEIEVNGAIVNPAGPNKMIRVELPAANTNVLTVGVGVKTNKFDVQVTLANGDIWTPIRGDHTVVEDQTRAII